MDSNKWRKDLHLDKFQKDSEYVSKKANEHRLEREQAMLDGDIEISKKISKEMKKDKSYKYKPEYTR